MRALLIGPSNIGDAVLASDIVAMLRARFPEAHLTVVAGARAANLFAGDTRIQTLVNTNAYDSPLGRLKLAAILLRYRPQIVIDLRRTAYPLLLKPLSVWRYLRRPPKKLTHMRERHRWEALAQVPELASVSTTANGLWQSPQDERRIDQLWQRWGLRKNARIAVICPGARSHIKRWGVEGFAAVADRLVQKSHLQIIFSGEPDEEDIIREVLGCMSHPAHSAVGLVTIRQLAALMRRAELVITNDSASLHVASAVETPTVAIFGPTDENKYGPTAKNSVTVRRKLFCAPCETAQCRFNHECMRFISADELYDAAASLLEKKRIMEKEKTGKGNALR